LINSRYRGIRSIMDVVGSDYVYLSDECSQDVFSFRSDVWSVGDPVNMPELNYNDEFDDIFPAAVIQSNHDNGEWLSDVLESACPNTIAGYVMTLSDGSGEPISVKTCADDVDCNNSLSPTDSGHYSIVSPNFNAECSTYVVADRDDFVECFKKDMSELSSQLDNNSDLHFVPDLKSEFCDIPMSSYPQEMDNVSAVAETEFVHELVSPRPQRVAARRAEIALAKEESSDCDDEDDDVDEVEDAQPRVRSRSQLQASNITLCHRGRKRAAEVNRNALNARVNRQKKKAYMASLETQKARLLDENKQLKSSLTSLMYERNELFDEVTYLKSVLANDSVLAKLVHSINGPPLKLSSRFDWAAQKRKDVEFDRNYGPWSKQRRSDVKVGGICLHVRENQLSMELCHRCARMADTSRSSDRE